MSELDLATLSLAITLTAFVCAAVMFAIWWVNHELDGIGEWMAASAVHGVAFMTPALAELFAFVPRYWLVALNNTLTLVALMLMLEGCLRFKGHHSRYRIYLLWLLVPVFAGVSVLNMQAIVPRYLFHGAVVIAGLAAIMVVMLGRSNNRDEKIINSLMAVFAAILLSAFVLRWTATLKLAFDEPASIPFTGLLYVATLVYTVGWTLSAILACYYRINSSLMRMAREDSLTGLPNRRSIDEELGRVISQSRRSYRNFMVILLDLDGFKSINDRYGHAFGDRLLKTLSARLQTHIRSSDVAGRIGGDEFLVIAHEPGDQASTQRTLQRLRQALNADIEFDNEQVQLNVSVGMAHWPHDGDCADELMGVADRRMYQDKASNRQSSELARPLALSTRD